MKVITTNLLNRFWENGIKPIKTALGGKLDVTKVIKSTNITEPGFVMDGKTAADAFAQLNKKLGDFIITRKIQTTITLPPNGSNNPPADFFAPTINGYKPINIICTFVGDNRSFLYGLNVRTDNNYIYVQFTNTTANEKTISPEFLVMYCKV